MNSPTPEKTVLQKVVSGGQTGVDRAALEAALRSGLPVGGWCPRGRLAEDGPVPTRYPLVQTPGADYGQRTEWNVRDSDGTLILHAGGPDEGTLWTVEMVVRHHKPHLLVNLADAPSCSSVVQWIRRHSIRVLNIAGPRESQAPGIFLQADSWLEKLFAKTRE